MTVAGRVDVGIRAAATGEEVVALAAVERLHAVKGPHHVSAWGLLLARQYLKELPCRQGDVVREYELFDAARAARQGVDDGETALELAEANDERVPVAREADEFGSDDIAEQNAVGPTSIEDRVGAVADLVAIGVVAGATLHVVGAEAPV